MFSNWWKKLYDKVLWRGGLSDSFAVGSGVSQGSILGGKFFNLMMDCVLKSCNKVIWVVMLTMFLLEQ